jgi:hypothetical protein
LRRVNNKRGITSNAREYEEGKITVKRRLVSNVIYKQNTHGSTVVCCKRRNNICDRSSIIYIYEMVAEAN